MDWYPAVASFAEHSRGAFFAAAATPMSATGHIPAAPVISYFESLVARGVDGLAVNAHTGRGPHLSVEDKLRLIGYARGLQAVTLSGVTEESPADAAEFAAAAASMGADALLVFPSEFARSHPVELLDALWEASRLPLIIFDLYTQPYTDEAFARSIDHPAVAGAKTARLFDAIKCADRTALVRSFGKLAITGEDRMFGSSLMWGAEAALVGLGAAGVEVTLDVFRSFLARDFEAFVQGSQRLDRFASQMFAEPYDGYVQRLLWVAEDEGMVGADLATDLFGPALAEGERDRVLEISRQLVAHSADRRFSSWHQSVPALARGADRA